MRSSSGATLVAVVLAVGCAVAVGFVRPKLVDQFREVKVTTDTYALPSPQQMVVASLGYRSAMADLLFAHVIVDYARHVQERRLFEFGGYYLDVITELDPKFRDPYYFADTLLTLQAKKPRYEDYHKARAIIDRGLEELPYDAELWTQAGQYFAYLSWNHLPKEEQAEWRSHGAKILARACELAGDDNFTMTKCVTAATLFDRLGEHEAMIAFLERMLILSEEEEARELARSYLEKHVKGRAQEMAHRRLERFHRAWGGDHRFLSRDAILVLGPRFDPARCAATRDEHGCATSWAQWHELAEE